MSNVTSERAGSVVLNEPPVILIFFCFAVSFAASVKYGVAFALVGIPVSANEKLVSTGLVPVLSATTATVPLVFLKAVRSRSLSDVVAAMRIAPGLIKRL